MSEVMLAMSAPVVHPNGPRKAKIIAGHRMAVVAALKSASKTSRRSPTKVVDDSKKPMTTIAKEAARQSVVRRRNIRVAKKAHNAFKKELKTTRRKLIIVWKKSKSLNKKNKKTKKLSKTQIKQNKMIRMMETEMKRREKLSKQFEAKFGVSMSDFKKQNVLNSNKNTKCVMSNC